MKTTRKPVLARVLWEDDSETVHQFAQGEECLVLYTFANGSGGVSRLDGDTLGITPDDIKGAVEDYRSTPEVDRQWRARSHRDQRLEGKGQVSVVQTDEQAMQEKLEDVYEKYLDMAINEREEWGDAHRIALRMVERHHEAETYIEGLSASGPSEVNPGSQEGAE